MVALALSVGVAPVLRHFGGCFPVFATKIWGEHIPYELFLFLNPLFVLLTLPYCSRAQCSDFDAMIIGSVICSLSLIPLTVTSAMLPCALTFVLYTVGENFWCPRYVRWVLLNEKKHYLFALLMPKYFGRVIAGITASSLLPTFLPMDLPKSAYRPTRLWGAICLMSLWTPLMLVCVKACRAENSVWSKMAARFSQKSRQTRQQKLMSLFV